MFPSFIFWSSVHACISVKDNSIRSAINTEHCKHTQIASSKQPPRQFHHAGNKSKPMYGFTYYDLPCECKRHQLVTNLGVSKGLSWDASHRRTASHSRRSIFNAVASRRRPANFIWSEWRIRARLRDYNRRYRELKQERDVKRWNSTTVRDSPSPADVLVNLWEIFRSSPALRSSLLRSRPVAFGSAVRSRQMEIWSASLSRFFTSDG